MLAVARERGIRYFAWPESEALVMFAGKNDIFGSGGAEDFSPGVGIPLFDLLIESDSEIVVVVIGAVGLAMIFLRGRTIDAHGVVIPFGVGIVGDVILRTEIVIGMDQRSPARDRVEPPMNKDAELCVVIPSGKSMLTE